MTIALPPKRNITTTIDPETGAEVTHSTSKETSTGYSVRRTNKTTGEVRYLGDYATPAGAQALLARLSMTLDDDVVLDVIREDFVREETVICTNTITPI